MSEELTPEEVEDPIRKFLERPDLFWEQEPLGSQVDWDHPLTVIHTTPDGITTDISHLYHGDIWTVR